MKRIFFAMMTLAVASIFMACGDQVANNKPANTAASNTNAAPPVNPAAIEADIKKLVTDYAASTAKNDAAAFDRTTADNFMFVGNDGTVNTTAERVASMQSGQTKYETLTYDDLSVRVNAEGDSAIVIGKATVKGVIMGKPVNGANCVTQVWAKTKDGWKMSSLQATKIEGGAAKTDANTKIAANTKTAANTKVTGNAKIDPIAADDAAPPPAKKK